MLPTYYCLLFSEIPEARSCSVSIEIICVTMKKTQTTNRFFIKKKNLWRRCVLQNHMLHNENHQTTIRQTLLFSHASSISFLFIWPTCFNPIRDHAQSPGTLHERLFAYRLHTAIYTFMNAIRPFLLGKCMWRLVRANTKRTSLSYLALKCVPSSLAISRRSAYSISYAVFFPIPPHIKHKTFHCRLDQTDKSIHIYIYMYPWRFPFCTSFLFSLSLSLSRGFRLFISMGIQSLFRGYLAKPSTTRSKSLR